MYMYMYMYNVYMYMYNVYMYMHVIQHARNNVQSYMYINMHSGACGS